MEITAMIGAPPVVFFCALHRLRHRFAAQGSHPPACFF
jgi:hypothetical protein